MSLPLTTNVLSKIFTHAETEYPEECCGIIFSDGKVRTAKNIQNELHRTNPERYPRDARRGYTMSVDDILFLENSFSTRAPAVVIYHSHPDVGAYFSDEDKKKALFSGVPIYPVSYLVIDVRQGKAIEAVLFSYVGDEFRQCQRLTVGPGDQKTEAKCQN
ncbi:Mov34/MPN/PAD-1 family protein [Pseudothauera rhizosphaerae]|uniref:MPN domain-containing protein n=1 Tax=Pseudothauera rhizosphaerae TaxID=2565932 RepID=A0A4V6RX65_9RHOO|nr:Mov34/MPN/PAD-1 family protein [Pseudothauera rhizosphaerae]THF63523.1 hypothetical protein E6O51_05565 [Pseudothauera rhizosphaerae]